MFVFSHQVLETLVNLTKGSENPAVFSFAFSISHQNSTVNCMVHKTGCNLTGSLHHSGIDPMWNALGVD